MIFWFFWQRCEILLFIIFIGGGVIAILILNKFNKETLLSLFFSFNTGFKKNAIKYTYLFDLT